MQESSTRHIDPASISISVALDSTDVAAAFSGQSDPNEQLYYDTFGPGWETKSTSARLRLIADMVDLATAATTITLKAGAPAPK